MSRLRQYLNGHREQLWAEALALYHSGVEARLPDALAVLQQEANEQARRGDDLLEDRLGVWLAGVDGDVVTIEDAARACGFVAHDEVASAAVSRRDQMRIAAALRHWGYEKRRERGDGSKQQTVWRRVA